MSILSTDYQEKQYVCALSPCEFDGIQDIPWLQHRHNELVVADLAEFMLFQRGRSRVVISDALILII